MLRKNRASSRHPPTAQMLYLGPKKKSGPFKLPSDKKQLAGIQAPDGLSGFYRFFVLTSRHPHPPKSVQKGSCCLRASIRLNFEMSMAFRLFLSAWYPWKNGENQHLTLGVKKCGKIARPKKVSGRRGSISSGMVGAKKSTLVFFPC